MDKIQKLHQVGKLIVMAQNGIRIMLLKNDIMEMLQNPIVKELAQGNPNNVLAAWCGESGMIDFLTKHTLSITNGTFSGIAVDALWFQACKVEVGKTGEEMADRWFPLGHTSSAAVSSIRRVCPHFGRRGDRAARQPALRNA